MSDLCNGGQSLMCDTLALCSIPRLYIVENNLEIEGKTVLMTVHKGCQTCLWCLYSSFVQFFVCFKAHKLANLHYVSRACSLLLPLAPLQLSNYHYTKI